MTRLLPLLGFGQHIARKNSFKKWKNVSRLLSTATSKKASPEVVSEEDLWVPSPHKPLENLPHDVTMPEFLRSNMGNWGKATAYECAITGRKYTHDQVFSMSRSFAAALLKSGLKRGDVVTIVLQNIPEYAPVLLGIWEAGLIASTANPLYTSEEIARQVKGAGAKCVVTTPNFLKTIRKAKSSGECANLNSIVVIGEAHDGCHTFSEMIKTDTTGVEFMKGSQMNTKEDAVLLPYSSGTTGIPKGVMLTHYNLCVNVLQVAAPGLSNLDRYENGNPQEIFLGLLPFFHSYGLMAFIQSGLYFGAQTICLPEFKPQLFLETIRNHKPTALHLVTPLISYIVNTPEFTKEDLAPVNTIKAGAAPIGQSLINKLLKKAEKEFTFQEGYGMTELSPVSHILTPRKVHNKIGSCGTPVPNTVTKIIDLSTGEALGRNEKGELCVKGPQMMKGYFNNEEATRNTIKDGWLHTGDIAYYDEDGYCYIVDRLKELIKVRGFQVAPSELEDILRKHPNISDVAVIGIPNEESGELPRAYIVPKDKSLKSEDVNEYLKEKVTSYKHLHGGIEFRDIIPKAPSGKILRRELKEEYLKQNNISS
jgi:acyl-CoA synthetase (AMP-forming)/AMP-acid ligase II